jgi:hypothetical protein
MYKLKFLFLGLFALASNANAFGVDVCFKDSTYPSASLIQNCIGVDQTCRTSNLDLAHQVSCRAAALSDSLSGLSGSNNIIGGRSLVHSDSTYMMAQLIGYTPWQAYQILIYSEATDQSEYTAFDQQGHQLLSDNEIANCRSHWGAGMPNSCLIITPVMNGIYKFNSNTGGMLLHLHVRYSANGAPLPTSAFPTDYFSVANKPQEVLLNNFRDWIFGGRVDACAGGITQVIGSTTSPCASTSNILKSPVNFFAPGFSKLAIPFVTQLGRLIINTNGSTNTYAYDPSFQPFIYPQTVAFAKMGIFLHVLGDRSSHHVCSDNSYFFPDGTTGNYNSYYAPVYCAQGSHFLWHAWEQGTVQSNSNLKTVHQTMSADLSDVYDQLIAYATYQNIPVNPSLNKTQIINDLIAVLGVYDPATRLNNMVALMDSYGVLPLPGHGSVASDSIDQWLTLAGAPVNKKTGKTNKHK